MDGPTVEHALRELGPEHRALVELSVVRGISDDEIGGYLGIDASRIAERRGAALHALASYCGDGSEEAVREIVAALGGDEELAAADLEKAHDTGEIEAIQGVEPLDDEPFDSEPVDGEVVPHEHDVLDPEPPPPLAEVVAPGREEPRGGRFLAIILGAVVLIFVVVLVITLAGTNDDQAPPTANTSTTSVARPTGVLEPLVPGGRARGRATITTSGDTTRLRLTTRGLPPPDDGGGYVVWLYDSVTDTRSLSGALRGTFTVNAPLPRDYRRYRFIDVSREPADGNRNHSGQSVLRVPLRSVPRR